MGKRLYEEIMHNNKLLAIIVRAGYKFDNIVFFTPPDFSQQLGYLPHKKGKTIQPHIHKTAQREVTITQEVLCVRKGSVRVFFYNDSKQYLTSRDIYKDDVILLCSGGHGFKMLEDTELIEIKQGPYLGVDDKERFDGVENDSG